MSHYEAMIAAIAANHTVARYDDAVPFYNRKQQIVDNNIDNATDKLLSRNWYPNERNN